MIIIHSLAHYVITIPKFTFPTKESICGGSDWGEVVSLSSKLYGLKFLHLISAYCVNMNTTSYDCLKCHPSPSGVEEDFDLYFTGNESGLFIWKKSNCTVYNYNSKLYS